MSYGTVQAEKMTTESGYSLGAGNASSFKNRIINGNMTIAQRTAGAVTNLATTRGAGFAIDRWSVWLVNWIGGTATQQQSTDVPSGQGFVNSLLVTVTAASSTPDPTSGRFLINQMIEGFNVADLNWGTASAKSVTVSFWVKSSVTGNYGFTLTNNASNRGYVVSYAINSANTWEQKTITIPGDTSGTWTTDNTSGIIFNYDLGVNGPTTDTVNTWLTGDYRGLTSGVNLINTLNATFYLTGVQFEVGTVATSFDFRSYGTELALCQRYYWEVSGVGGAITGCTIDGLYANSAGAGVFYSFMHPVTMRTAPTATVNYNDLTNASSVVVTTSIYGANVSANGGTTGSGRTQFNFTSTGFVKMSAEL